ncbi:MAG: translation initiation factor IF-2 [Patescibacteria group bacterium]
MSKQKRSPIVVVMGHIDHGKSSLLDYIRQTNVTAGEAGGITQAVSAYEADGLTFLDTPGHEAFSGIRERGASIADLAILIVSAEEGVKAQTLETLAQIQAANIPFIVAINKIDRPNANANLVKQQLAEKNLLLEGYGGTVPVAEISAKTGAGVPELLELLHLLAEMQNLTADSAAPAQGFVLEAHMDHRAGVTTTLIIKDGTLQTGSFILIGNDLSKIKRLNNFKGEMVRSLGPASPAQVVGLAALPTVGASFVAYAGKVEAEKALAESVTPEKNQHKTAENNQANTNQETKNNQTEVPVILKADVLGSLEALKKEVLKLGSDLVRIKILSEGVGRINENEVKQAGSARGAIILGFNVARENSVNELAEKLGVEIATFEIIYKLSEWLAEQLKLRTPKQEVVTTLGRAKLLKIFSATRERQIVGGVVTEGQIALGKTIKILRRDNEIARGKIVELQEQKLPTKEVGADRQFGAAVEVKVALVAGDVIEAITVVQS